MLSPFLLFIVVMTVLIMSVGFMAGVFFILFRK